MGGQLRPDDTQYAQASGIGAMLICIALGNGTAKQIMQNKKGTQLRIPFNLLLDYVSTKERGFTKSI